MTASTTDAMREALLAELRAASLRARLAQADIDAAGIAVKHGLVTPEEAMRLLWERDALPFLDLEPRRAA